MTLDEVKNIIRSNPNLSYEDIAKQATEMGIAPALVKQAWEEEKQSGQDVDSTLNKKSLSGLVPRKLNDVQLALGFFVGGLLVLEFSIRFLGDSGFFVHLISSIAVFLLSTFILFLVTMLLGCGNKFVKSIQVSIVLGIISLAIGSLGIMYLLAPLGFMASVYILNLVYNSGIMKSIIIMILHTVLLIGTVYIVLLINDLF